jgi:aryl-alcohol dehydrogenase-like predicted oxidoreductase
MSGMAEGPVALGRTGLHVSPLGVGTNTWGASGEDDPGKIATWNTLRSLGITLVDTAEIYTGGASERTIGGCIAQSGPGPLVLTKFFPFPWRLRGAALRAALRGSLARLGIPRVDIYLLHFPWPPVPLAAWANALADAVEAGLVRAAGISNCSVAQTREAHAVLAARGIPLACNEVELNLLNRRAETSGLLAACRELDVTVIAYRPLALGMLTGKYSSVNRPGGYRGLLYGGRYLNGIEPLVAVMKGIAGKRGRTVPQVALNWVVSKGALPIAGAKNPRQATENAGALGWRLTPAEIAELETVCP